MAPVRSRSVRSLKGKIFATVLTFTLGVILVMSLVLTVIYYVNSERDGAERLLAQARDAAVELNEATASVEGGVSAASELAERAGDIDAECADAPADGDEALDDELMAKILSLQFEGIVRFTLIGTDGVVLYDSATPDPSTLENHGSRPEVVAARSAGEGAVTRFSETLGVDTVYAAVLLDDGSIVRLSETRSSFLAFVGGLVVPIVASLIIAVLLAFLLSRALTRRIMRPIDALDISKPLDNVIYEEMDPLLQRIDEQQRQLLAQNEELARAESMRRDFSANVSHEMKTPLQVISGYAELMRNGMVPPEDTARFAGLIYDESQAMRSLINDVLTLSRLDEVSFEGDSAQPVDLLAVAWEVAGRREALAAERRVSIEVLGNHAAVAGSETLFEEMLYNLVDNGIRYNEEGGRVRVEVNEELVYGAFAHADQGLSPQQASQLLNRQAPWSVRSSAAPQRQVVVRVSDTGPGIPPDEREKIFERFYRMEKSRSKETGGTGLGLAIVKHAVLYHNGTIEVEGNVGEGTTFVMRFPAL